MEIGDTTVDSVDEFGGGRDSQLTALQDVPSCPNQRPSAVQRNSPTISMLTLVANSHPGSRCRGLGRIGPPAKGSPGVPDASAEFATSVNVGFRLSQAAG